MFEVRDTSKWALWFQTGAERSPSSASIKISFLSNSRTTYGSHQCLLRCMLSRLARWCVMGCLSGAERSARWITSGTTAPRGKARPRPKPSIKGDKRVPFRLSLTRVEQKVQLTGEYDDSQHTRSEVGGFTRRTRGCRTGWNGGRWARYNTTVLSISFYRVRIDGYETFCVDQIEYQKD